LKKNTLTKKPVVSRPKLNPPGRVAFCAGCHYGIITRVMIETMEEMGILDEGILLVSSSCFGALSNTFPADVGASPHGRLSAVATAIKRLRPDTLVVATQGDGDLCAIGMGHFMHSLVRAENYTTIFLNNACYGQTGGQMAPTTLQGMRTTTTYDGRNPAFQGFPVHMAELAASMKGTAFSVRCTVHSPANYQRTKKFLKLAFQKQMDKAGSSFVELLSACPTNWKLTPVESLRFIEEEMISEFPLGEFKNVASVWE